MLYRVFKVRGSVGSYGGPERLVTIDEAGTDKPVMMQAYGDIMKYIDDVSSSDMEEKYMDRDFIYDGICQLVAVLIPSTHEWPALQPHEASQGVTRRDPSAPGSAAVRQPRQQTESWSAAQTGDNEQKSFQGGLYHEQNQLFER